MRQVESWIAPSKRQMLAKCVADLVAGRQISTSHTDDDLLWCRVDLDVGPDNALAILGIIVMSWGPPVLMDRGEGQMLYLFNPLQGRIKDALS